MLWSFVVLASRKPFVFEPGVTEVNEQSHFDSRGVQVINDLRLMFGGDSFHCFQLDNDLPLDE